MPLLTLSSFFTLDEKNDEYVPYGAIFWDKHLSCGEGTWQALNLIFLILCIKIIILESFLQIINVEGFIHLQIYKYSFYSISQEAEAGGLKFKSTSA